MSAGQEPEEKDPDLELLERKLGDARRELLETTTRSRLLHTPLGSTRAKIIRVEDEKSDQVFHILVQQSKAMSFLPAPDSAIELDDGTVELPQPGDDEIDERGIARRHSDTRLQTVLNSEKLQTRLRSIAYDAQTIESEQGVNILYLALGFLKWLDKQEVRYAPLVLVPVSLARANATERFKVSYSGEELATNLSLKERLKQDSITLPDLEDADDLVPSTYLGKVSSAVAGMKSWEVLPNSIVLGFFSFAKLMMYRDLEPDRWPSKDGLRDHPIIRGLLGNGLRGDSTPRLPDDDETPVDPLVDIAAAGHVVDADSSQMLAIEEVKSGRNLVIQGPPGTGKSQTITNLIATAVREGKRVLFVAEKMAALDVVRANLERIDLGQMCLELHSHKARKKAVLEDLGRTMSLNPLRHTSGTGVGDALRALRDKLNEHARRIHTPLEVSGLTPFQVFGALARLTGNGVPAPDFRMEAACTWTHADFEARIHRLARLVQLVEEMGAPCRHVWRGVGLDVVLPQDASRIAERMLSLCAALGDLVVRGSDLARRAAARCDGFADARLVVRLGEVVGTAPDLDPRAMANDVWISSLTILEEDVEAGTQYASARGKLDPILIPPAWEADLENVRREFIAHGSSWLRWLRPEYRAAVARFSAMHRGAIPKRVAKRIEILHVLSAGLRAREQVRTADAVASAAFGRRWQGERSDWELLRATIDWERDTRDAAAPPGWRGRLENIGGLRAFAAEAKAFGHDLAEWADRMRTLLTELAFDDHEGFDGRTWESIPFEELKVRLRDWAGSPEHIQQWCLWRFGSGEAATVGLRDIVERLADGRLSPSLAVDTLSFARHEALARQTFSKHHELAVFDGTSHGRVLEAFQKLDHEGLRLARREVAARHVDLIPRGGQNVGEMGVIAREIAKQRRHLPLRQLIKHVGRAMQRIKPVWMMSPMSLAQFVEPGALRFDLVLMDEASQVRPVEALGAIARGSQLVVVGDEKQLPPTSFFDRVAAEDAEPKDADEFQVADVESILGLCTAQGIPDRMLRWHYRSQHESLIAVSNQEFYRRLFIVPSAESADLGLRLNKVSGVYDRGRTATNRLEAQAVAKAVVEHARRYGRAKRHPAGMSLGVGTFSVAQRDAILDELEVLWRRHPEVAPFFDPNSAEPFFVKNLESIQGDERDVVFISVGYGKDADGHMAMLLGPLTTQGGERRLNVLITRARRRCEVFSSITSAEIDLARTGSIGVRILKSFLHYAETGNLERSIPGVREPDSDFEVDVAAALTNAGYKVEHQVGVAGFFVDLAIRDLERPGRYLLGIECDGRTYHSSRSARDRDRLREQVLRDRGWRIHRIWSTDWFKKRQAEIQRAIAAIEQARAAGSAEEAPVTIPDQAVPRFLGPDLSSSPAQAPGDLLLRASEPSPLYVEATHTVSINMEPHELGVEQRLDLILDIVRIEEPIHAEEVGRRFAAVCGRERAGSRIQEATRQALEYGRRKGLLVADGLFFATRQITELRPRDRSRCRFVTVQRPDMLPVVEISTGLRRVVQDHLGVAPEEAIVQTTRLFGFQRAGPELKRVIEERLRGMLGEGLLTLQNGRVYVP